MGTAADQWATLGMNAAGAAANQVATGAIGTIMGLALEKHNDQRQLNQQQKLQDLQIKGNEQLTDYNYAKQLDIWHATSYPEQVKMMEEAGLSPALMYGMGGGGGTTANINTGNVSGAEAPKGGHEVADEQGMGIQMMQQNMQLALLKAQKDNIDADTANKKAQAAKTAGIDTDVAKATIGKITADTGNIQVDTTLKQIETKLQQVNYDFAQASMTDRLDLIAQQARTETGKATQALVQGNIDEATKQTKIKQIQAEYIGKLIENVLTSQLTNESKARTRLDQNQADAIIQNVMNNWSSLANDDARTEFLQKQMQFNTNTDNSILQGLTRAITDVITIGALKTVDPNHR